MPDPEPEPDPVALAAEVQAWRAIRGVLAAEPVAVAGDTEDVVQALARIAAASIAARLAELAAPIVSGLALAYAEHKLSQLLLADALGASADAPVPADEPGRRPE